MAIPVLSISSATPHHTPADPEIIAQCDRGLASVVTFARGKPELFARGREGLLTLEEKSEIWNTWKRFLEYEMALEAIAQSHSSYYEEDENGSNYRVAVVSRPLRQPSPIARACLPRQSQKCSLSLHKWNRIASENNESRTIL